MLKAIKFLIIFFVYFWCIQSFSEVDDLYIGEFRQKFSLSNYRAGLEYASRGQFKEAKEKFKSALDANEFSTQSQIALGIIEEVEKKTKDPLAAQAFFSNILLNMKIEEVTTRFIKLEKELTNLRQQVEDVTKKISEVTVDFENKLSIIKRDIDYLRNDVDYIKHDVRSRRF